MTQLRQVKGIRWICFKNLRAIALAIADPDMIREFACEMSSGWSHPVCHLRLVTIMVLY